MLEASLCFILFLTAVSNSLKLGVIQAAANDTTICDNALQFARNDGNCADEGVR